MESDEPGVLGPMLFLLFVMPPPLLSAGSFWPSIIGWRNLNHHLSQDWDGFNQSASYQRSQTNPQHIRICDGAFDLYFLVDTSENMENNWKEIYTYVNEMVKKYTNPKLRMSFVTYSTHGQTLMTLTSDRNTIRRGLTKLQNIVPSGDRNMQEGMKKVNEQLQQVYSRDNKAASLIVAFTAGDLSPKTIYETANEAHKARKMGAKIYNVGLKGYSRKQLIQIMEDYGKMYESKYYDSLDNFVNSLIENSCLDVMGKETYFVCVEEVYNLGFNTRALQRDRLNEYVCRYNLDDTVVYTKKAINMTNVKLICPGHVFEKAGQVVVVEYSLNNGVKFQDSTLKVTSRNCRKKSTASPAAPLLSTVAPATTLPAPPHAQTPAPQPVPPPPRPPTPPPTKPPVPPPPRPPTPPPTKPPVPPPPRPPTPPPTKPPVPPPPRPPTPPPTKPPVPPPPRPPTPPPTKPPVPPPPRPPTPPPTKPPVPPPPRPPTPPPTKPPVPPPPRPPTPPPTKPPVPPPPRPPTPPPTKPPVPPPPRPPTPPPTKPPVPPPPRPPTPPPTKPPVPPPPRPPTPPPTKPPVPPPPRPSTTPPAKPTVPPPRRLPAPPPAQPPALPAPTMPSPQFTPIINNLYFIALIPALLMFPLLIWCIWCCKRTIKKSPPVEDQKKKPKSCHIQTCPIVIVPCHGCQEDRIQRLEGKLDTLCDFVQNCNQVSLMWHQPRDKGKCLSITPVKPHCAQTPCGPKICLAASQECSPLNSCCSLGQNSPQIWSQPPPRMLPLIPPPTQALRRTTLSLPPP
ncbi:hypothetical protein HJG60_010875 [Phyllostomus discolor]|uniref:VWFA domain-containing protein n=1 Tax=Phyllostomus discolor TaxID=89673 RepID=A0A834ADN1_9CHIR|nr:hypothetical protein HJG60_010875 [Phyllostomus discolor]